MTPAQAHPGTFPDSSVSDSVAARNDAAQPEEMQGSSAPELAPDTESNLVALAFSEYHRLCLEGQPPDIGPWCAQFPFPSSRRAALCKMLEMEIRIGSLVDRLEPSSERRPPSSSDDSYNWPAEGEQRAGFRIVRELARGAFARVYLATEASTGDRLVVLKCSLLGDAEARTMGRLSHPGIVPILSARREEHSGLSLVCMPYLGTATLADVLSRVRTAASPPRQAAFLLDVIRSRAQPEDPPPPAVEARLPQGSYADSVLHLAAQLAETLAFLHQRGVSHRDLKPSNVLLDPSAKPLLLDFNLSNSAGESGVPFGGTLRYMAPEQLRAFLDKRKDGMDERADLYALGVMVYELLAGDHPCGRMAAQPAGPELAQALLERQTAGFRTFRDICPELERPVAAILDRCLAVKSIDRPRSAAELAAELKRHFTPARRLRRWLAARRRYVLAVLCLLVMTVAVLAHVWVVTPPYSQREYDLGRSAYHVGDFAAAEAHFDHAVRAEPNSQRYRFARGCARLQQSKSLPFDRGRLDQMAEDLASMEPGATDAQSLAVNAYVLVRKQHFDEAIAMYSSSAVAGYKPLMVLNNRAFAYMSKCEWEKAQLDLDRAVQLDPHCQAVRSNRARIAMQLRLQKKINVVPPVALEDIEQALRYGPKTSTLYRDASVLYALAANDADHQARMERALSYLRQALMGGESPNQFQAFPLLREALTRTEFSSLVKNQPRQSSPQLVPLIDPVDLPE